jgi:hypothetical protein
MIYSGGSSASRRRREDGPLGASHGPGAKIGGGGGKPWRPPSRNRRWLDRCYQVKKWLTHVKTSVVSRKFLL